MFKNISSRIVMSNNEMRCVSHISGSDVNKAISIKAKAKAKAKCLHPSVTSHLNYES